MQCLFFWGTVLLHWIGIACEPDGFTVSPFWPLTGWIFICYWFFGVRPTVAIVAANLAVSYWVLNDVAGAILFGIINSVSPILSVLILQRIHSTKKLVFTLNTLLLFITLGAVLTVGVQATLGLLANIFCEIVTVPHIEFFETWFLSALSGMVIFAPIFKRVFDFVSGRVQLTVRTEFLLLLAADFFARSVLFSGVVLPNSSSYPLTFLLMPIAFWAGLRLTFSELTVYVVAFSLVSILGTTYSLGPFGGFAPLTSLLLVQVYAVTQAVMMYIIHTILDERKKEHQKLEQVQDATIMTLASLTETRDSETGSHILRTKSYVRELTEELRRQNLFTETITQSFIDDITKSAPLHDIGKVGIPDSILLKPGRLSKEEFEVIKTHTVLGEQVLRRTVAGLGKGSYLELAVDIAGTHHEKWDGTGYPCGLQGDNIPLAGRIMAVADVYDALTMERVYKAGMSHEQALEIMLSERGKHFDPVILDTFVSIGDRISDLSASVGVFEELMKVESSIRNKY